MNYSKINQNISKYFYLLMLLGIFCSCAVPEAPICIKEGKRYGLVEGNFRQKWWNYYERGFSYSEGKCFEEALKDFKEAIKRQKYDRMLIQAYGTKFVNYFPHRESGIVYYKMGKIDEAKAELETSLRHSPSAKAKYYLNLVRKAQIERNSIKINPPQLILNLSKDEVWTKDDPFVISGVARDENFIAEVIVRDKPLFLKDTKKSIHFEESLFLPQGCHIIEIEAKNLMGKSSKRQIIINVDREGPIITVNDFKYDYNIHEIFIDAVIKDSAGVSKLFVNKDEIPIEQREEILFRKKFSLKEYKEFKLVAHDSLGNLSCIQIPLTDYLTMNPPILFATTDSLFGYDIVNISSGNPLKIDFFDELSAERKLTVFQDKISIKLQASSNCEITELCINNHLKDFNIGKFIGCNHIIKLEKGENTIIIKARDKEGHFTREERTIIRKIPPAICLENRLSLWLSPLEEDIGIQFRRLIIRSLCEKKRFRILEDEKYAKIKINWYLDEKSTGIEIFGDIINVKKSEYIGTIDGYKDVKTEQAIEYLANFIALEILQEFPLMKGTVSSCENDTIISHDIMTEKLWPGGGLFIYREECLSDDDLTNCIITNSKILGYAEITQIKRNQIEAKLQECINNKSIKEKDNIITE